MESGIERLRDRISHDRASGTLDTSVHPSEHGQGVPRYVTVAKDDIAVDIDADTAQQLPF
jgi:hypothetical protein